ncbi:MAG TPA: hydroxymethylbilane synthase [Candidatus Yaniella excrementigallinarum]|nr:hydroxymethylbilane synthase [Candidatus Yaniella excrementigallinarum]
MAYRIGTRGSALATTQTQWVADAMSTPETTFEQVVIKTTGDITTGSLANLGGTGVFATALRQAVIDGDVDMAVHSLKDLPAKQPAELHIAAIAQRADVRDALCASNGMTLDTLPHAARIGTGSPRRVAQLLALRPDLEMVDIRGNVHTRLARVAGYEHHHDNAPAAAGSPKGDLDAVVLACAGLDRLNLQWAITERIDPAKMLPAPGQGSLAVEVSALKTLDPELTTALTEVDHTAGRLEATAERALLETLEAGCAAPLGGLARYTEGNLHLDAVVAAMDGTETIRRSASTGIATDAITDATLDAAYSLGVQVAQMLISQGVDLLPPGPPRGTR